MQVFSINLLSILSCFLCDIRHRSNSILFLKSYYLYSFIHSSILHIYGCGLMHSMVRGADHRTTCGALTLPLTAWVLGMELGHQAAGVFSHWARSGPHPLLHVGIHHLLKSTFFSWAFLATLSKINSPLVCDLFGLSVCVSLLYHEHCFDHYRFVVQFEDRKYEASNYVLFN